MKFMNRLRDNLFYCGVSKTEYNSIKKQAYVANFNTWKSVHLLMVILFGFLVAASGASADVRVNIIPYVVMLGYSVLMSVLFLCVLKPDSLIAQFLIYLTMVLILLCGLAIGVSRPDMMAVTFEIMLVILPIFMIDKPYFMTIVLVISSIVFLAVDVNVKSGEALTGDVYNTLIFCVIGIYVSIFFNGLRVREFLLQKTVELQRDTDDLTGLLSKDTLVQSINSFIKTGDAPGLMMVMDIDDFKHINDTYGHDAGDAVLRDIGTYLKGCFRSGDIKGRFGGDEFIIFLCGTDNPELAARFAGEIIAHVNHEVRAPGSSEPIGVSIGVSPLDKESDRNYDSIFKKADLALYEAKKSGKNSFRIHAPALPENH